MYLIRVMLNEVAHGAKAERNFQCEDYTVTKIPPGHPFTKTKNQFTKEPAKVGLYFDGGAPERIRVVLPYDGRAIFVMNEQGQTVQRYGFDPNEGE